MKLKQWTTRLSAILLLSLSDTVFGRKASNAKIFVLHFVDFVKIFINSHQRAPPLVSQIRRSFWELELGLLEIYFQRLCRRDWPWSLLNFMSACSYTYLKFLRKSPRISERCQSPTQLFLADMWGPGRAFLQSFQGAGAVYPNPLWWKLPTPAMC